MKISDDYVDKLQPIYRDILSAFPKSVPTRKYGYGLSYQSIYSELEGKYSLFEIRQACENMRDGGVVKIEHTIFVNPTPAGEALIAAVTKGAIAELAVPPFPPLPA